MSLVHEQSCNTAWPGIDVFVCTPSCEIYVPVVELYWYVSCCVGEIPAYCYAFRLGEGRYGFDIEVLTRVVVDTW